MNKRFNELTERLVASGRPADHFSCSELHELYDGIKKLEAENKQLQKITTSNSDYAKCEECGSSNVQANCICRECNAEWELTRCS